MRLILEKRADRSPFFAIASPFLALLLMLIAGGLIFAFAASIRWKGFTFISSNLSPSSGRLSSSSSRPHHWFSSASGLRFATWPMSGTSGPRGN